MDNFCSVLPLLFSEIADSIRHSDRRNIDIIDIPIQKSYNSIIDINKMFKIFDVTEMIYALIYLSKIEKYISADNVYQIYFILVMLSHKYILDIPYDNLTFSRIYSINIRILNRVEIDVLTCLKMDMYIKKEIYDQTVEQVNNYINNNIHKL